jgi:hypothetical protein
MEVFVNKYPMSLNPYQINHLLVTLTEFEETLRLALDMMEKPESKGILFLKKLEIEPKERQEIRELIQNSLVEIQKLSQAYNLLPRSRKANNLLVAKMSVSWANLIDTQSSGLKNYGKLEDDIAENLDPIITRLSVYALRLSTLFSKSNDDIL